MTPQPLTDSQIRAAFQARAAGSSSPDLAERIHSATRATRQHRPLVVLPGGLSIQPQRLLFAAAISATSLAMVGGLLIAGRQPDDQAVVPPPPTPVAAPSNVPQPSETPSESPAPSVTPEPVPSVEPTPVVVDPAFGQDDPLITLTGELRVRSLPTVGESSARLEPLLPVDMRLLVVEAPVQADGYTWYHVIPLDSAYPSGWVAAGSRDGAAWLGSDPTGCPETTMLASGLATFGPYGGLMCFGNEEITVSGTVTCGPGDVDTSINGPTWIRQDLVCAFEEDGMPVFYFNPDGVLETPVSSVPMTVTGHFADEQSSSCEWVVDPPAPEPAEVVAMCRDMFVVTDFETSG